MRDSCRLAAKTTKSKTSTLTIPPEPLRLARCENLARLRRDDGKKLDSRKKVIVEFVFGNIKSNKGMRIFVRGRRKVDLRWKMAMTAHNLKKIVGAMAA